MKSSYRSLLSFVERSRRISDVSTITLSAAEDNNNYFKPIANGRKTSLDVKGPSRSSSRDNLDRVSRKSSRKLSTQKTAKTNLGSSTDRLNGQRKISHSSTNLSLGSDFTKSVKFLSRSVIYHSCEFLPL